MIIEKRAAPYMPTLYKASVIVAFYNKPDFLKLVLAGFEIQSFKDFEIIIADDGSKTKVVDEINKISKESSLAIKHVWHEDEGWRKNEILNRSVLASKSDYLIFTDGDCIPHDRFVEEHLKNRKENTVLAGRRANLFESLNKKLTIEAIKNRHLQGYYMLFLLFKSLISKKLHFEYSIYIKSNLIRKLINNNPNKGILGSNFSLYKEDLVAINGFDTRYRYPAVGEDTDLELRLRNHNVNIHTIKNMAIQYHLYHPLATREYEMDNYKILNETKEKGISYTPYGLDQL